jgi:Ca2+-binding RTX toxin-like protein
LTTALFIGFSAGTAEASSVTVSGGTMTITANPGEENRVDFGSAGSDSRGPLVRVIDSGSTDQQPNTSDERITAGGTCNQSSNGRDAFCPTDGVTTVIVNLGDEDDEYDGGTLGINTQLDLGPGDDKGVTDRGSDTLRGGEGDDEFEGGGTGSGSTAKDTYEGGSGEDTFDLRRSAADDVSGGPDADVATFRSRSASGINVTLDDQNNDGTSSERDNVKTDVEKVIGTSGADRLTGSTGPNILEGGLGADSFEGKGGGDTFLLRDGVRDNGFCVNSNDTVDRDLVDILPIPCVFLQLRQGIVVRFNIFIGAINEGPNVRIAERALRLRRGRIRVQLRCPRGLRRGCRGRLSLRAATRRGKRLASARYRIRSGRRKTVTVRVRRASSRKTINRHGVVGLEAVERGDHGRKTTFAYRTVR